MLPIQQSNANATHSTKQRECYPFDKSTRMLPIRQSNANVTHSTNQRECYPFDNATRMLPIRQINASVTHSTKQRECYPIRYLHRAHQVSSNEVPQESVWGVHVYRSARLGGVDATAFFVDPRVLAKCALRKCVQRRLT